MLRTFGATLKGCLTLMWFTIDMLDGSDSLWFYWPMFGTGIVVAIIGVLLQEWADPSAPEWERREIDNISAAEATVRMVSPWPRTA